MLPIGIGFKVKSGVVFNEAKKKRNDGSKTGFKTDLSERTSISDKTFLKEKIH